MPPNIAPATGVDLENVLGLYLCAPSPIAAPPIAPARADLPV